MNDAWVHTLNPFAIQFFDGMGIRWYGLAYLAGFLFGYLIIVHRVKSGRSPLTVQQASDFVFQVALGTIIGGRLGYVIFYNPALLTSFTSGFPFWGVLAINEGGMASHGGIIGIVAACWLYSRRTGISFPHLMDITTLGGSVGIFFGRIANFINGELVGRPVEGSLAWAVKFPQDITSWPTQEPSRIADLAAAVQPLGVQAAQWQEWSNAMFVNRSAWDAVNSMLIKIVEAVQHGNVAVTEALAPYLTARHPSQLYEALLEGALLFTILMIAWRKPRHDGVITGIFLTCYAIVRIIGEQYRMPDAQLGFQLLGLTRGQWLSFVMLVPGLFAWRYFLRRGEEH